MISQSPSVAPPLEVPVEIVNQTIFKSNSTSTLGQVVPLLPYMPEELTALDQSIVCWLKEIGILTALNISPERVDTLFDLQAPLTNGVLLCTLVTKVLQIKITGIFRDPKTEATCLSNIRKALKILQMTRKMS